MMTIFCWHCKLAYDVSQFTETRPDDFRFYGGKRVRFLRHHKCRKVTILFATTPVKRRILATA